MTEICKTALVGYSSQQMFDLINDIEAYPEYMDGCFGAEILARDDNEVVARLELGKRGVSQQFVTRNRLAPPELMTMELVEGPFKSFVGAWRFEALNDEACKITLLIQFEFKNVVMALAAGPLFEKSANQQVDALCARAEAIYG